MLSGPAQKPCTVPGLPPAQSGEGDPLACAPKWSSCPHSHSHVWHRIFITSALLHFSSEGIEIPFYSLFPLLTPASLTHCSKNNSWMNEYGLSTFNISDFVSLSDFCTELLINQGSGHYAASQSTPKENLNVLFYFPSFSLSPRYPVLPQRLINQVLELEEGIRTLPSLALRPAREADIWASKPHADVLVAGKGVISSVGAGQGRTPLEGMPKESQV